MLDQSQEYPEEMEKHLASLRTNQSFIENALRYKYSIGPLEGTNSFETSSLWLQELLKLQIANTFNV